jgi:MiaB-like tRNA modifying enzyme YliG, TIGR01125
MSEKICVTTLGCAKNIVDSEKLISILGNKYTITENPNETDYLIINTCGFISSSIKENTDYINSATKLKQIGKIKKIFVVGCLVERFTAEFAQKFPVIDGFFGVDFLDKLPKALNTDFTQLYGERHLLTPSHYAYLKISDGCEHNCAFCSIPSFKGGFRSEPLQHLVEETKKLVDKGVKELILIAQDTTSYGVDLYGRQALNNLLIELDKIDGLRWIRLMYAFPRNFPLEILDTIRESNKIVKYIDIPIQHISTKVLRKMGRGMDKESTIQLLNTIREKVPGIAIRTTIIVGFPNETENEFQELVDFVEQFKFDRLGVFEYSMEKGTPAFVFGDPIPAKIKRQRYDKLMLTQQKISKQKNKQFKGKTIQVIVDEISDSGAICRTQFDAPEIDNLVHLSGNKVVPGDIIEVKITHSEEYDLFAKRLKIK